MSFLQIIIPNRKIYTQTRLFGIGRAESDGVMRANLRKIAAALSATWYAENEPELVGKIEHIFDVLTTEQFYENGYAKTVQDKYDPRLWLCSYIGFETLTSKWAKETIPACHGVICMRLYNQDERCDELEAHTVQIYF